MAKRRINVVRALGGPINEVEQALEDEIVGRNIYGGWIRASDGSHAQVPIMSFIEREEEYERTRQRFMEQMTVTFDVPPSFVTGDTAA